MNVQFKCLFYGIVRYILLFFTVLAILIGLLIATAMIPNRFIKENMKDSAEFLCEKKVFFMINDNIKASKIDRYADSILLSVAYHMHSDDTLRSVMLAEYYANSIQNENNNLYDTLFYDKPANKQYLRYWHGSASVVRLMHIFFDIKGIYITNGILLSLLAAALFAILIHGKIYSGAVGNVIKLRKKM